VQQEATVRQGLDTRECRQVYPLLGKGLASFETRVTNQDDVVLASGYVQIQPY
jgi:hypothetical protein